MSFFETVLLGLALSLDCCAVALASTASGRITDRRSAVRLSFHFGLFQFLMPILGWVVGSSIEPYIAPVDHWVAFGLLAFVAYRMIRSASGAAEIGRWSDPTRGWLMVSLAFATSVDALAIGVSLAALRISAWYPSAIIGLVTMAMSMLAVAGGTRVGRWLGPGAQYAGGLILIFIGVKVVISHIA